VHWFVDAMNVIGTRPDGWWRDRDDAMRRLVGALERWAVEHGDDVTVVFERPPRPPIRSTVIAVAHAPRAQANAADDEIVRLVEGLGDRAQVRVVTSDRWLSERATDLGASVVGADTFRRMLEGE